MQKRFLDYNPQWLHQPKKYKIEEDKIEIVTQPNTDYWQRTYYGFRNDKAPILFVELSFDFTFQVKVKFNYSKLYDHCGIILYQDSQNWVKLGTQYENQTFQRLGSVVTNLGYSDWATHDISITIKEVYYKLSRRGQDFYIQHSLDGKQFKQMRMLHMHKQIEKVRVGIFACSPLNSSYTAEFANISIRDTEWVAYKAPQV